MFLTRNPTVQVCFIELLPCTWLTPVMMGMVRGKLISNVELDVLIVD